MDTNRLAQLLFPDITGTPDKLEARYPDRNLPEGAQVTRMGPSPTGFIHLGNLYGAFVDERMAHGTNGIFYLRIEDTDDKRYVEGAVETITSALDFFGISFDEGAGQGTAKATESSATATGSTTTDLDPQTADDTADMGDYGPYYQSLRAEIYQTYVRDLVARGVAYPCFLTEEELAEIRKAQEAAGENTGIYGKYAEKSRNLSYEEIEHLLNEGKPYVIRLRSKGNAIDAEHCCSDPGACCEGGSGVRYVNHDGVMYIHLKDAIRGEVAMPANDQDVVILKANGIPTYHFAHVVDDHLMRTTHVVRGEEWLMSLPIHVELFERLGFELPTYCHTAVLMKIDDETGNKRKLSKRLDPELSLDYYRSEGYHPDAVKEYLMTILNSDFEEWRMDNQEAALEDFDFSVEKMSSAGALFDLNKLKDVSKEVLSRIPATDLADFLIEWAEECRPEIVSMLTDKGNPELAEILDIGRNGKKPRKDLVSGSQIIDFISYFYDGLFRIEDTIPEEVSDEDAREILKRYLETYDHSDDQSQWFDKIRAIATDLGYAAKPKDYKKNPDDYKGHVGHVSTVVRIAVTGRSQSPDIWEIQQILGEQATRQRIEALLV